MASRIRATSGRRLAAAVALCALLATPLLALQAELWPVCTMSCSVDGGYCCCTELRIQRKLPSGEDGAFDKPHFASNQDGCPSSVASFDHKGPKALAGRLASGALIVPGTNWSHPNLPFFKGFTEHSFALLPRPPPRSV